MTSPECLGGAEAPTEQIALPAGILHPDSAARLLTNLASEYGSLRQAAPRLCGHIGGCLDEEFRASSVRLIARSRKLNLRLG